MREPHARRSLLAARQQNARIDQRLDEALGCLIGRGLCECNGPDCERGGTVLLPRRYGKLT